MAKKFYENPYTQGKGSPIDEGNFDFPTLTHRDHKSLNRKVSKSEIKITMFQMDGLKPLGPDGLSSCFYQQN